MVTPPDRIAPTSVPIDPLLASRWSPRNFDANAAIDAGTITALLEAGRWAATWGKRSPVRYVVGLRADSTHAKLADLLTAGNSYAKVAAALILVSTDLGDDDNTAVYAAVDAGLSIGQLGVEARSRGLHTHPLAGFDVAGAQEVFAIPENVRPIAVVAVGAVSANYGDVDPAIAERDCAPRKRPALAEIAFIQRWGQPLNG